MSERASTSNGEFCLLTDGRRREDGGGGMKKKALLLHHGRTGEGGREEGKEA